MPRRYPPEVRRQVIELARAGTGDVPIAGENGDPGVASALSTKTKQEVHPDGYESSPE